MIGSPPAKTAENDAKLPVRQLRKRVIIGFDDIAAAFFFDGLIDILCVDGDDFAAALERRFIQSGVVSNPPVAFIMRTHEQEGKDLFLPHGDEPVSVHEIELKGVLDTSLSVTGSTTKVAGTLLPARCDDFVNDGFHVIGHVAGPAALLS